MAEGFIVSSAAPEEAGIPPNPVNKPGYRLEFDDSFQDRTLNRSKWLPYYLPQWSSREKSVARYFLDGSTLKLLIEKDQNPWCPEHDGVVRVSSLQTGCYSGPTRSSLGQHRFNPNLTVTEEQPTIRLYTPRYGYFETRLKAVRVPGYMIAFWMIGFEELPEQSAEICICEIFGNQVTGGISTVGYGIHPFNDPALSDAFYYDAVDIHAVNYHIYAAEWTPTKVTFFIDNELTRTVMQSPNYPMQFMLGIYEIPEQLNDQSLLEPWPKMLEVDYVRGYRPVSGYLG